MSKIPVVDSSIDIFAVMDKRLRVLENVVNALPNSFVIADNYTDLATAIAAASAGQCVLLTPGKTYTVSSTIILPVGVSLWSPNPYRGNYGSGGAYVTGSVSPLFEYSSSGFVGKQTITGITFNSTASGSAAYIFKYNFPGGSNGISNQLFFDCSFNMSGSSATDKAAIWYTWAGNGTVEQCYYMLCWFQGCDTAIGGSDSSYISDWDKCVVEKCRFDSCKGTANMPGQIMFYIAYMRTGAIRDCVFEGTTNGARSGIFLGAQFQCFEMDNIYMESMATAANNTYDEIQIVDPPGSVTPGANLSVRGTRLGDAGSSSNVPRYSLNLNDLGGSFRVVGNPTFTNGSANITMNGHKLRVGDAVIFTTSGTLPTNFTAFTQYYVIATNLLSNTFQVSATVDGGAITAGSAGSGTHTLTNMVAACDIRGSNMGNVRMSRYGNYNLVPWLSVDVVSSNLTLV